MVRHKDWIYKKIYKEHYGEIPRGYHIHHIDGNKSNNHWSNLQALPPRKHYNIHYKQGDYAACMAISKHFDISESDLSKLSNKLSEAGKEYWRNHPERRIQNSESMKKTWGTHRKKLIKNCRRIASMGAQASKLKNAHKIEYNEVIYCGWPDLRRATGVTKALYKKYYMNGIDPTFRIGTNGPLPGTKRGKYKMKRKENR